MKTSFIELSGRERALALLDQNSFNELLGPFDQLESPHLEPQGIVPESDDGMVIAKGKFNGEEAVVLSIEGAFQGGGIGEVCGTKIAASLEKVLEDSQKGKKVIPIIIFDTGGVRLQEANYGLLVISEIQSAIVALRNYVPVIGLIPGNVGSFGGMSITAALCSELIMTDTARFGLNGPEVIELEAGIAEFNAHNRRLIWDTIGGIARFETGLVDQLVEDDVDAFKKAIQLAIAKKQGIPRTRQVERFLSAISQINPAVKSNREQQIRLRNAPLVPLPKIEDAKSPGRGRTWFKLLSAGAENISEFPGILVSDVVFEGNLTRFIAVVPNAKNIFPRALNGEVGLMEGWMLAKYIQQVVSEDSEKSVKRNIVAIIDVPSQAYGYNEELFGIHYACAASVDAYATARLRGHKVVGLIVGNAISGAFLAHGLQASRLISLNDDAINVQAMSKQSAAKITKRTISELEEATRKVPAMAYDIQNYYRLGALDALIEVSSADQPTPADVEKVSKILAQTISDSDYSLSQRLKTEPAQNGGRNASILVREKLAEQWN